MSWYKKLSFILLVFFVFTGCSFFSSQPIKQDIKKQSYIKVPAKEFVYEDVYIVYALELERQKNLNEARLLYGQLFFNTNKQEYLLKYLTLSYIYKNYKEIISLSKENLIYGTKEYEDILRVYIYALLKDNQKQKALEKLDILLENYPNAKTYQLQASIYTSIKEYKQAYHAFKKSYDLEPNINTFLAKTNIQYYYIKQKKEAKESLENSVESSFYYYPLVYQLLGFYQDSKDYKNLDKLLNNMEIFYEKNNYKKELEDTQGLKVSYLSLKDSKQAIKYIESNDLRNHYNTLLYLYEKEKEPKKAYKLLEKLFNESKNYDYLARMAIIEFEEAKDKQKVLDSVIEKFEKVNNKISNHIYQNYYAYILIDFNKDVKKGLVLVKKALKEKPDNYAYLDTLAWGEFKNNNCKKAFEVMSSFVNEELLKEEEIKNHWEKIKECK